VLGVELGDAATGEVVGVTLIEGVLLAEEFELGDTDGTGLQVGLQTLFTSVATQSPPTFVFASYSRQQALLT
jgi:hypothetical protein